MEQRIPLDADEILFVRSADGVIGVVKSGAARQLFIETVDDEIVMTVDPKIFSSHRVSATIVRPLTQLFAPSLSSGTLVHPSSYFPNIIPHQRGSRSWHR